MSPSDWRVGDGVRFREGAIDVDATIVQAWDNLPWVVRVAWYDVEAGEMRIEVVTVASLSRPPPAVPPSRILRAARWLVARLTKR